MSETVVAPAANDLFLHNVRALWRCDPELAVRVDAVNDDERFPLVPTRSGAWTVRVPAPDGVLTYLHSRNDPVAEADQFSASIKLEGKYCFVVAGLGLGYHVRALLERLRGDAFVVCTEPNIRLIATAFTCVDLFDAMVSGRLFILIDAEKARLHERLKNHNTLMMLGAQFVRHPASMRVAAGEQGVILQAMADFVTFTRMSLMTLVANSKVTCENIAMNLVHYVRTPPIDVLRDRFAGDPAIVISAGPSLRCNIDQLPGLKGRAVLCAVQTALRPLTDRGIVPDFVTSLDFHEISRKFFESVGDLSKVHLIAEPKATWHVTDHFPGLMSLLDNHWARLLIGDGLATRDGLKPGATVAHLAFYLAEYLGCDPIIFVGQDLAFSGHVFYVPGVEIHRAWRSELNRFCSLEQKEWERIARNRPILRQVPSHDGGEVYTDELLLTYLEQFEKDIAATPRRIINATEGGARIRGTESMSLGEAGDRFCRRPIDPARFGYRSTVRREDSSKLAAAGEELGRRIGELDEAIRVCEELLRLFDELEKLTNDPDRFNRRLARVDELRAKVHRDTRVYQIINSFTQWAELRRYAADRRIYATDASDVERAKQQIARDREFITGVREGAVEIKPMLARARARIVEALERV